MREAAELVAFDILEPALRSRGGITERAKKMYEDGGFQTRMRPVFEGEPTGRLVIGSLADVWKKIEDHGRRLQDLEERLKQLEEGNRP